MSRTLNITVLKIVRAYWSIKILLTKQTVRDVFCQNGVERPAGAAKCSGSRVTGEVS